MMFLGGKLCNFQLQGMKWLIRLYENGINGILADEMGLGKTVQAIALMAYLYGQGMHGQFLVIAPLTAASNWLNEFKTFAPKVRLSLKVIVI